MKIGIWAGDTGASVSEPYLAHSGTVNALSWSPDGGTLASGGGDGAVCLWETNTGRYLRGFKGDPVLEYTGIAWSPDGKMLALGTRTASCCGQPRRHRSANTSSMTRVRP